MAGSWRTRLLSDTEEIHSRESSVRAAAAMAFTLWALLEAALLVVNAVCVLHEQRFLAKSERTTHSSS